MPATRFGFPCAKCTKQRPSHSSPRSRHAIRPLGVSCSAGRHDVPLGQPRHYDVGYLRAVRAESVGAERAMPETEAHADVARFVVDSGDSTLASRHRGWIRRYAADMTAVLRQLGRVVKGSGRVVLVLGNSFLRVAAIDNAGLVESLARSIGFETTSRHEREIPARRRYLLRPAPATARWTPACEPKRCLHSPCDRAGNPTRCRAARAARTGRATRMSVSLSHPLLRRWRLRNLAKINQPLTSVRGSKL